MISPTWSMSATARVDLYHVLLAGDTLGFKAARMLLGRLRDDFAYFDPPARTGLVELAARCARANINAYLDMCALVPDLEFYTIPSYLLLDGTRNGESKDAQDVLRHERGFPGVCRLSDSLAALSSHRPDMVLVFSDVAGRLELQEWGTSELPPIEELCAVALWAGAEERGLYAGRPGLVAVEVREFVRKVAPELAERIRRLAVLRAYPDPLM